METLVLESPRLTWSEWAELFLKERDRCLEKVQEYPVDDRKKVWELLTSRGEMKMIYGPLPEIA